ncbi:MAG: hypothetical protein ACI905_001817 [Roseivirga sp.]|jgi:uncharacterized protein YukE
MRVVYFFLVFLFTLIFSCGSTSEKDHKLLVDAFSKQKEAIELMEQLETILENTTRQDKDSISNVIEALEESLFAIPGYKLELPGHEGHDHGYSRVALSAEEIYKALEDLFRQLQQIQTNLNEK